MLTMLNPVEVRRITKSLREAIGRRLIAEQQIASAEESARNGRQAKANAEKTIAEIKSQLPTGYGWNEQAGRVTHMGQVIE